MPEAMKSSGTAALVRESQESLWEPDEARLIREATEMIGRHTGQRPDGWLGPGMAESDATPDLLKEAGYS